VAGQRRALGRLHEHEEIGTGVAVRVRHHAGAARALIGGFPRENHLFPAKSVPEKPSRLIYEKVIVAVEVDVGDKDGQFRGYSRRDDLFELELTGAGIGTLSSAGS
jgi:hypothetical protein